MVSERIYPRGGRDKSCSVRSEIMEKSDGSMTSPTLLERVARPAGPSRVGRVLRTV